jgi:hypothetical protein
MIEWFDNNVIKSIQESYIMKTQKNSVVQSFNAKTAIEKFNEIQNNLNGSKYLGKTHSEIESYITIEGREILRLMLQEHINARGNGWVGEAIESDKQVRDCQRLSTRHYYSPFGQVYVERLGYKTIDVPSIFPLDDALNLPENCYSHQIQKRVGRAISGNSINDTRIDIHNETSVKIANRQLEEIAYNSSLDFESFYESQVFDETMNKKPINVLSFDGKGIVMQKKHLTEETKKRAEKSSPKLEKKLSKGEKKNKKRMATVAAIYSIDRNIRTPEEVAEQFKPIHVIKNKVPPKPVNKKVSASIKKSMETVIHDTFSEALKRDPEKKQEWVVVLDGDHKQIDYANKEANKLDVSIIIIMDIIHVLEYIWKAARSLFKEDDRESEKWVGQKIEMILKGEADIVIVNLFNEAVKAKLSKEKLKPIAKCLKYLSNHTEYLKYNQYLASGYPIGTGIIEGTCRHLVRDRMELTGARWSVNGAESILKLRALRLNNDFDEYWVFHEKKEYQRNHQAHSTLKVIDGGKT